MQGESPKSLRDQRRRASLAALCIYKIKPHEAQHQIAKSWTPSLRISGPLLSKSDMLLRLRLFVEPCRGQNCKSRAQLQCKNCTPFPSTSPPAIHCSALLLSCMVISMSRDSSAFCLIQAGSRPGTADTSSSLDALTFRSLLPQALAGEAWKNGQ